MIEHDVVAFEKVSIAEAKAALHGKEQPSRRARDWTYARSPLQSSDVKLEDATIEWLLDLPEHVRPLRLARKFPRIANKLSREWKRPVNCDRIFDELMIDYRGTRQGFPFEVAKEITELRAYFSEEVFKFNKFNSDMWVVAP